MKPAFYRQLSSVPKPSMVNDEEQYSIWPADRENALGWRDAGKTDTKAECLCVHQGGLDRHETA